MDKFLSKIVIAVKRFNDLKDKLSTKDNYHGRNLPLRNLIQTKEILNEAFDSNIEPDKHLINYYLLIIKKSDTYVDLYSADYLVYKAAIASLSKYYNPPLSMIMTQSYTSAYEILTENLIGLSLTQEYESQEMINAISKIKGNVKVPLSYIGAALVENTCKTLMNDSIDLAILKLKKKVTIKLLDTIDLFSLSVLEIMIANKNLKLP
jgi:hypothetical protein